MSAFPALGPLAVAALANLWTVGGLVALGTLAALRLTRGAAPRRRYVVALTAFAAAAVAPLSLALAPPSAASALSGPAELLAALPDRLAAGVAGRSAAFAVGGLGDGAGLLLSPLVALAWLAGALLLVAREGAALAGLAMRAGLPSRQRRGADPAVGWPDRCRLVTGDGGAPMAWGLLRPTVYLPRDLPRRLSASQLRAVLAHELDHVRWRDPAVHALVRFTLAVLWPAWPLRLLAGAAAAEREAAADRAAVRALGEEGAARWAETLLAVARSAPRSRRLAVGLPGPSLAGRVDRLLAPPPRGRWRVAAAGAVVLVSLVAAGAVPVSAAGHRWDATRADREGWTWFDRLLGENPEIVVTVVDERRIVDRRVVRDVVARDGPDDESSREEAP